MIWRTLTPDDIPALMALQRACYASDGYYAIPLEWDFADSVASRCATHGDQLIAAAWLQENGGIVHLRLLVHPDHRDFRAPLLEWAKTVQPSTLRLHDEAVTETAHLDYNAQGFTRIFAEDVMRHDPSKIALPTLPEGIILREWSDETAPAFYAAYVSAFSTRPVFNPQSQEDWIADHQDDPDFRADLSYVAIQNDEPLGYVVSVISTARNIWGKRGGWIDQVGVIPAARGKGLASHLMLRAMQGMADTDHILLHVNVDNPTALRVYQHLGFTIAGRRARYQKD